MSNYKKNCYTTNGKPQKLLLFIHGYNGSPEAIDYAIQALLPKLKDTMVCVPYAPQVCEKNPENLQWFSLYQFDPESKFRDSQTPTPQIFDIFQNYGESALKAAAEINDFVDMVQKQYHIDDAHTYICGFSQGAMLSLYTSLTRKQKIGGCIAIAGIVPGMNDFSKHIVSKPPLLLLHGEDDGTVQYKTLPTTINFLLENGLDLRVHTHIHLAHQMNEAEMQQVADFVNDGQR